MKYRRVLKALPQTNCQSLARGGFLAFITIQRAERTEQIEKTEHEEN